MTKKMTKNMSIKTAWNGNVFVFKEMHTVFDNLKSAVFVVVFGQVYLTPSLVGLLQQLVSPISNYLKSRHLDPSLELFLLKRYYYFRLS